METLLSLLAAALTFATAVLGLLTIEWATKAVRLRRRVEFLRAELAATPAGTATAKTLARMRDLALAELVAIELVPSVAVAWRVALIPFGMVFVGWAAYDTAGPLGGRLNLETAMSAYMGVIASAYGATSFLGSRGERERIFRLTLRGKPFRPLSSREWSHAVSMWGFLASMLVFTVFGCFAWTTGAVIARRMGYPIDQSALATLLAVAMGGVILAAIIFGIAGFLKDRKEPITRAQAEAIYEHMLAEEERAWGVPDPNPLAPEPQTEPAHTEPLWKRNVTPRAVLVAWLLSLIPTRCR